MIEYYTLFAELLGEFNSKCNNMSSEGWELVSVSHVRTTGDSKQMDGSYATFKRVIPGSDPIGEINPW